MKAAYRTFLSYERERDLVLLRVLLLDLEADRDADLDRLGEGILAS
jgi:hypothetical protein